MHVRLGTLESKHSNKSNFFILIFPGLCVSYLNNVDNTTLSRVLNYFGNSQFLSINI